MTEASEEKKEPDTKRVHTYPLIRHSDMNDEMRTEAMELCVTACEKFATNNELVSLAALMLRTTTNGSEHTYKRMYELMNRMTELDFVFLDKNAAKMIKETMDKKFGASWHAVVGEGYGFELTHEVKNLLYMFFGGNVAICVWKCS